MNVFTPLATLRQLEQERATAAAAVIAGQQERQRHQQGGGLGGKGHHRLHRHPPGAGGEGGNRVNNASSLPQPQRVGGLLPVIVYIHGGGLMTVRTHGRTQIKVPTHPYTTVLTLPSGTLSNPSPKPHKPNQTGQRPRSRRGHRRRRALRPRRHGLLRPPPQRVWLPGPKGAERGAGGQLGELRPGGPDRGAGMGAGASLLAAFFG